MATGLVGSLAVAAGGITAGVLFSHGDHQADRTANAAGLAQAAGTSLPPWARPADTEQRARTAGLVVSSSEGTRVHFHAHLDVFIDGKPTPVATGVGVGTQNLAELHTHDATGVLHIEAPAAKPYTLGELFTEWNVRLDPTHLGGFTTGNGKTLGAYVGGKPFTGNPATIPITAHEEIALAFGAQGSGTAVPSNYKFPQGE